MYELVEISLNEECSLCLEQDTKTNFKKSPCCKQSLHIPCVTKLLIYSGINISCPFCRHHIYSNIHELIDYNEFKAYIQNYRKSRELSDKEIENIRYISVNVFNDTENYNLGKIFLMFFVYMLISGFIIYLHFVLKKNGINEE